jgi:hypothetical protein
MMSLRIPTLQVLACFRQTLLVVNRTDFIFVYVYNAVELPASGLVAYADLVRKPKNLDRTKLESYLADDEFQSVFGMGREQYSVLPKWKQANLKKSKRLF